MDNFPIGTKNKAEYMSTDAVWYLAVIMESVEVFF